jgi:basic membrane protein A
MSTRSVRSLAVVLLLAFVLPACAPALVATPTALPPTAAPPTAAEPSVLACQVTDVGGIDDKSFNATAWKGMQDAQAEFGIDATFVESQQQTDYEKNIEAFVTDGCDLIVTVGFLLGDATKTAAERYPDQKFAIIDVFYEPPLPNVVGLRYAVHQATFLAGYLAAGVTKTGRVGTFGGIQFRELEYFMDGFALGVEHYNTVHGTEVEVLGWDPVQRTGLFAGNFESTDDGRRLGETLMDEGADIIMPVAGPVGLGTAAAIMERGNAYLIGVDTDWTVSASEFSSVTLTSILKRMDVSVMDVIREVKDGTFEGRTYLGTLDNGGVDLAPYHDLAGVVPDELQAELDQLRADIIAGQISTVPANAP